MDRGDTEHISTVRIENTGNVIDTARLSITGPATDEGWGFTINPSEITLWPGESDTIEVHGTAPDDEMGRLDYTLQAETAEGRALELVRGDIDLKTPSVESGEALILTIEDASQNVTPGDGPISFAGSVYNPTSQTVSNVAVAFNFNGDSPEGFGISPTSVPLDIGPGVEQLFTFEITVPNTAIADTHDWKIDLVDSDETVESYRTIELTVNQIYDVDVAVNATWIHPTWVDPGELLEIELDVSNLGNGNDEICIEADLPVGWEPINPCIHITPEIDNNGDTRWNSTIEFTWKLDVESWAKDGPQTIKFRAVSNESDDETASDELEIEFTVAEKAAPAIASLQSDLLIWNDGDGSIEEVSHPCTFGVVPGGSVSFTLELSNEGNKDADFELSAESDWSINLGSWSSVREIKSRWSDPDAWNQKETITVSAPPGLDPGDFVEVDFSLETGGDSAEITCTFEAAFPDLAVIQSPHGFKSPGDLYADFPATLNFEVWNIGWRATGQEVTVRSTITGPNGFEHVTDHAVRPLAAGGFQELAVTFNATEPSDPEDPGIEDYEYLIEVDPDEAITQRDDDSGGAPKEYVGTFRVEDFGIELLAPPGPTVIPEQQVSFEGNATAFQIVNKGTLDQELDIRVEMTPAWSPPVTDEITLEAGETHTMEFSFVTPSNPRTGEAKITVSAQSLTVEGLKVQETTRIKIDDDEPPAITGLTADTKHTLLGGSVNFTADIQDATGVADARLYVVAPDGQSGWVAMEGDKQGGAFEAMWRFEQLGFHEVHVWARDASVSNNTVDTKDDPLMIEVLTTDRPHIRLVTPEDESAVRPGTNLVITVLSARPVVDMNYTLASPDPLITEVFGPIDLAPSNPVHIDTEEWSEGAVLLYLEARDSAGATASGNFSFIMDATSPEVQSIQLDPPGAGAGTEVNVLATVTDNVAVASVVVRFEDADGRAQEWDMENVDGDEWTARIVVPENPVSVSVIATDTAGNRGYGELRYGGPDLDDDSRLLPALPVALILFAVASVLFVRRRRVKNR